MSAEQFIDLSHTIESGMITYQGLPAPIISEYLSREESRKRYAAGTEFHIGKLEMVANTGTYLDTAFHRYSDGDDLSKLSLESVANLDGLVIRRVDVDRTVTHTDLQGVDVRGKAVLFHTGWDKHWRTETYSSGKHPFLDAAVAEYLAEAGAALVGIDSYNIDDTATGERPVHSKLLAHNIPIVEHLCRLGKVPDSGFKFFAVPPKVKNFGTFAVRAFAIVSGT